MAGYGKMMQQMTKMQKDMEKKQAELDIKEFNGSAGGGAIEVTMNGKREVVNIHIIDDVIDVEEKDVLIDMLKVAVNDVLVKIETETEKEMGAFTKGAGIPGLF